MTKLEPIEKLCIVQEKFRLEANALASESARVASVARNARQIIDNLDKEFEKETSLDSSDVKFLIFATILQVARWMIFNKISHFGETADVQSRVDHNAP